MRVFPELAAVAVVTGAGLGLWLDIALSSPWPLLMLGLAALVLAVGLRLIGVPAAPVVLGAALVLGAWRGELVADASVPIVPTGPTEVTVFVSDAPTLAGTRVRFRGTVIDDPARLPGNVPVGTNLLVHTLPPPDLVAGRAPPFLRYGDTLRLTGSLERPEPIGDFDYAAWLESQGIAGVLWTREAHTVGTGGGRWPVAALHCVRGSLASALQRAVPAPESGLAQALLLGIRSELPAAVKDSFRTAGMSHLLAISGLHVGIVLALALGIGSATLGSGNALVVFGAIATVWIYAVVSGLDPPVVRAAIMGSLVLVQRLTGRGMRGLTALTLAAGVMVCADPTLLSSLSFQLSFTAMAGVIVGLPVITLFTGGVAAVSGGSNSWVSRWLQYALTLLIASVVISTTTTLATIPLIAVHFGEIPLMSVPATLLAMPAMPLALVASAATAAAGVVAPWLAQALGVLVWAPVAWIIQVAEAMPPVMAPTGWVTPAVATGWYAGLAALAVLVSSRRARRIASVWRRGPRWRPRGIAAVLAGVAPVVVLGVVVLIGQLSVARADGLLHVHVLDVGQGDAILVVTPQGQQVLIDGGPDPRSALVALGERLPPGDRSLDAVVVTHLDSDHAGGLIGVLDRYDADIVMQGPLSTGSALFHQWNSILDRREHPAVQIQAGHRIQLDSGVLVEVLHPPPGKVPPQLDPNTNNLSVVMRVTYGDVAFLLTGDVEADVERYLVDSLVEKLNSDVLKVAHHGSRSSTSESFLLAVSPASAVISAGRENRYGHPHAEVTERLGTIVGDAGVFITARDGTVEYITDGSALWVEDRLRPPALTRDRAGQSRLNPGGCQCWSYCAPQRLMVNFTGINRMNRIWLC